nr:MAG TPA: hypothetical protein [Caudoviricetes sp.]
MPLRAWDFNVDFPIGGTSYNKKQGEEIKKKCSLMCS